MVSEDASVGNDNKISLYHKNNLFVHIYYTRTTLLWVIEMFIYHWVKKKKTPVESKLLFNASTSGVNMSLFFFLTKSPQLKTACYLRERVTFLYLCLTRALPSMLI